MYLLCFIDFFIIKCTGQHLEWLTITFFSGIEDGLENCEISHGQ